MSTLAILPLAGQPLGAISVTLRKPWRGVWTADVDIDLGPIPVVPTGKVTLKINEELLIGTVDDEAAGKFGDHKATLRIVGGSNGWSKPLPKRTSIFSPGLTTTELYTRTAALVGEPPVVDALPSILGEHYIQVEGSASRIFDGSDWYVRDDGITFVGPRIPSPMVPTTFDIIKYEPALRRLHLASDKIVHPGGLIVDPRVGSLVVRSTEQTWSSAGSSCIAEVSPASEAGEAPKGDGSNVFVSEVRAMIAHEIQPEYLRVHRYIVHALGPDSSLTLTPPTGIDRYHPGPIKVWPGMSGLSCTPVLGTEVLVHFIDGDPTRPAIVSFAPGIPVDLTLDSLTTVRVGGPTAAPVALAGPMGTALGQLMTGLIALGNLTPGGTAALAPVQVALAAALGSIPSKKLLAE